MVKVILTHFNRNAVRRIIQEKLPTHLTFLMELNDYYEKYDKEKEDVLEYLETDIDELFKGDEKDKEIDIEKVKEIEKAKAKEIEKRKLMDNKEVKQYKKIKKRLSCSLQ